MDFKVSVESRHSIIDEFLQKNDLYFKCSTKYSATGVQSKKNKYKIVALFEDGFSPIQVIESVLYRNVLNFVQNSFWPAKEKITLLFTLAERTEAFYEENFRVLGPDNLQAIFRFNTKTDRTKLIQSAFEKLELDADSNRSVPVRQTMDELIMNAQFSAPNNSTAKSVESSILIVEKNEKLISISVIDHYGSMDIKKFLKKIETALKLGRGESINYGRGGAGLGGSIIYSHSDFMMMGCQPLRKTRVTSVLPYNIKENKFSYIQKSICILD